MVKYYAFLIYNYLHDLPGKKRLLLKQFGMFVNIDFSKNGVSPRITINSGELEGWELHL